MIKAIKKSFYAFFALLCACGNAVQPTSTAVVVRETVVVVVTATAALLAATDTPASASTLAAEATNTPIPTSTRKPNPTAKVTAKPIIPTRTPRPAPTDPPPLALDSEVPGGAYAVKILYQKVASQGLVFRVIASRKKGKPDGDGIKSVKFIVTNDQGDVVYQHTENNHPYCGFQESNDGTCRIIPIGPGAKWYNTDTPIGKGFHTLQIIVRGKDDNQLDSSVDFEIK